MKILNLKTKFKPTTLQLTAIVIIPLFVFALVVKIQERQKLKNETSKVIMMQHFENENNGNYHADK